MNLSLAIAVNAVLDAGLVALLAIVMSRAAQLDSHLQPAAVLVPARPQARAAHGRVEQARAQALASALS